KRDPPAEPTAENTEQRRPVDAEVALAGRVLFMGDSITHAGHYVSMIDAVLRETTPESFPDLINLGLPSEGVTGLSEPDHPFPRPNAHERLERALETVKPDLVFACYGMNDGIYYPFSEERFAAYRSGIDRLVEVVHAAGAKLVLVTPPPFDPEPLRAAGKLKPAGADTYAWFEIYENYDTETLAPYSAWLLDQRDRVEGVIDAREPVLAYVAEKRRADPAFTLSNDGVHLNEEGHRVLAGAILDALGIGAGKLAALDADRLEKVHAAQMLLHAAWMSHVGHTRPQVRPGLPLPVARAVAALPESETPKFLFNQIDLKGWDGDSRYWSVEPGERGAPAAIVGRNEGEVPSSTYLFTEAEPRDFRLFFEVRQTVSPAHSTMHSAVAALGERIDDEGGNDHGFRGPLLMFCHDWGIWDAHRRNRVEPVGQKGAFRVDAEKVGDWNLCEILVIGDRLRFAVNGASVFDFTDQPDLLRKSPLGLQLHKNAKPQEYRFRGLVLTESPEDRLVSVPGH
ncbi:MAG: DUF1080 domain-containing protein, partial [Verrucomicrobiae bacterium]|nr:DUF1080 domain-containing protein [Verrucomicrobiae bacterium]